MVATLVLGAVGTVLFFVVLEYLHARRSELGCGVFVPSTRAFIRGGKSAGPGVMGRTGKNA